VSSKRAERALQQILRETRTHGPPNLDWDRLERRLPSGPVEHPPVESSRWGTRLVLAAAALALFAGVLTSLSFRASTTTPPGAAAVAEAPRGPARGELLLQGASVSTLAEARTIEHPGRASWTLAPHGQAKLVTNGDVVVVRLERGRLTARIVPSTRPETFAVETADVRVAAHGTVFSVTLDRGAVAVSVEEGSVLVGPRAKPGVGELLAGPSAGRFTLSGEPVTTERKGAAARPAPRHGHPTVEAPVAVFGQVEANEPPAERVAEATDRVAELASACFSERTSASDGVRVTAHTVLAFGTAPDGSVSFVRFDPPLAPNVQTCIDEGAKKLKAAPSPRGFRGSRAVALER
jgi:ferric-dicitrate binding protein FerR (iron transport regulator)